MHEQKYSNGVFALPEERVPLYGQFQSEEIIYYFNTYSNFLKTIQQARGEPSSAVLYLRDQNLIDTVHADAPVFNGARPSADRVLNIQLKVYPSKRLFFAMILCVLLT